MNESGYECADCGRELSPQMSSCPNCGSTKRNKYIKIIAQIYSDFGGKTKDKNKVRTEFHKKLKLSKKGKIAKEELVIDKPNDRKYHHVEELENEKWTVVHHEDKPLPKKAKKNIV